MKKKTKPFETHDMYLDLSPISVHPLKPMMKRELGSAKQVPENITGDVAGNKNLASDVLQVSHYSVPMISSLLSAFVTTVFALTSITAGLLSISTASLQSLWTFKRASSLTSHPARNLFVLCEGLFDLLRNLS